MKSVKVLSLLVIAILALPTASLALDGVGFYHSIPVALSPGNVSDSIFVARSVAPASLVGVFTVYDANGVAMGQAQFLLSAGTTWGRQTVFTMTTVLSQAGLASGDYTGLFYDSLLAANIFFEQFLINPFGNLITARLAGRGNGYGYTTQEWALTLIPESSGGVSTGVRNIFYCDTWDRDKAVFLGLASIAPGSQGGASLVDSNGNVVLNNYSHAAFFKRLATALSPGATSGGSLFLAPPANFMECVQSVQTLSGSTVTMEFGMYTL